MKTRILTCFLTAALLLSLVVPSASANALAIERQIFTFVTEELPRVCRKFFRGMTDRREDNYVAGLSMGGVLSLLLAQEMDLTASYIGHCSCLTICTDKLPTVQMLNIIYSIPTAAKDR